MIKNVKRIIGFLCCLIFCTVIAVSMPQMVRAADIAIDKTNFPDEIFRNYVISRFDNDANGKFSEEEITKVKEIYVREKGIKSLKGIEYFTALTDLDCFGNQLMELDISKNIALINFECACNQLTELDISKNIALAKLRCSYNQLTELDTINNIALIDLDCDDNQIKKLDIQNNTALTTLTCPNNQLIELDIKNNTALTGLCCSDNKLTELDVTNNNDLIYIQCDSNELTELNITQNTLLTLLYCDENKLTTLDVTQNTALKTLHCGSNKLTTLDISQNIALIELWCFSNNLTKLDISQNTALEKLWCAANNLKKLDISQNTALTLLYCYFNGLTKIDVSQNMALTNLDCSSNYLTNLDVSQNMALKSLSCYDNSLTQLNINNNTALTRLSCFSNLIKELDVSHNVALKRLECAANKLTTLDISQNIALTHLYCSSSSLTELKLNSQTYDKLSLYKGYLHGSNASLSDLQNLTETKIDDSDKASIIKVTDISKPATYKVNDKDFTIIYIGEIVSPTINLVLANCDKLFYDYDYTNPVSGSAVVIYGNGKVQTVDGKKVNNKALAVYTDILASYKYSLNSKGIVKPSIGKVIVGVTKSDTKPEVNSKNKITDTSASKIAKARIKNGQITVTAVGKESGLVYLWVIDTGSKGVSACCPINVKLAPTKLEVQNTSGSKLAKNTNLENGKALDVCVAGLVGSAKTEDATYTATVDPKYQSYITVTPVQGNTNKFTIKAIGLKNNKDTKVTITFKCDQNGRKTNLSLTITK